MRLAVISDIHGNLPALEAVLTDIAQQGADKLVCLGDVASFGPQPRETLRSVQALRCLVVMGNADAALLEPPTLVDETLVDVEEEVRMILEVDHWCAEQLQDNDLPFVETFAAAARLEFGDFSALCFHGSPRSYHDVIVATTPDEQLESFWADDPASLMLGGHTHAQLLRRVQDKIFINPGSVGLPFEQRFNSSARNPPWAEYTLIESVQAQPSVTFRRVPYDTAPLIAAAQDSGMPHTAWWLKDWLA